MRIIRAELPWMQDAAASTPRLIANTMAFSPRLDQVDWHGRASVDPLPELDLARDADMVAGAIEASADRLDDGDAGGTRPTPSVTAVQREEIERLVRSVLYQARDRPTLLLANAGNLRRSWPWIGNDSLVRDMLGFSGTDVQRLAAYGPDLRFVLTRDSNGREEVPQWYAPGNDRVGFAAGLWAAPGADTDNRVFVSTADSSSSTKVIKRGLLKLGPHPDWPTGPAKTAWNPRYLELTVVGCLSEKALADAGRDDLGPDQPAAWAALTHQLRFHDDYEPLSRPLSLHLAKLAEEYVLPTESDRARRVERCLPGQGRRLYVGSRGRLLRKRLVDVVGQLRNMAAKKSDAGTHDPLRRIGIESPWPAHQQPTETGTAGDLVWRCLHSHLPSPSGRPVRVIRGIENIHEAVDQSGPLRGSPPMPAGQPAVSRRPPERVEHPALFRYRRESA
ncbi:RNAseH domain-containing protein [Protofrankia symbiont of Coriaria ruscifolia]|uniref:RNAseH domain-containing protein n=1 Tax=Protofrankia symbiont of Coriaria ruscifolia TaxID=1306542 RepID=UPI0010417E71|nr:RNAseH domain-containing protein [Protofrankia symbiont of Coriaria ruscifolia]